MKSKDYFFMIGIFLLIPILTIAVGLQIFFMSKRIFFAVIVASLIAIPGSLWVSRLLEEKLFRKKK